MKAPQHFCSLSCPLSAILCLEVTGLSLSSFYTTFCKVFFTKHALLAMLHRAWDKRNLFCRSTDLWWKQIHRNELQCKSSGYQHKPVTKTASSKQQGTTLIFRGSKITLLPPSLLSETSLSSFSCLSNCFSPKSGNKCLPERLTNLKKPHRDHTQTISVFPFPISFFSLNSCGLVAMMLLLLHGKGKLRSAQSLCS